MSLNISSANHGAGYTNDYANVKGNRGESTDTSIVSIKTEKALQKAELSGTKVSIGDEHVVKNIERVLKALQGPSTSFEMSVHEATKAIVIKVMNKETGELIREVPPEKTLDLVAKFMEINGILIDERV